MRRVLFLSVCVGLISACNSTLPRQSDKDGEVIEVLQKQLVQRSVTDTKKQIHDMSEFKDNKYIRYEKAKLLYMLALQEADWEKNKQAQSIFEQLLADDGFIRPVYRHAELQAYYGSLYSLKGRDLPGWWWINNMTPVGLVRVYYVMQGVGFLNRAVELDAEHPVVRLIRGNTFVNLPGFAGTQQQGIEDMLLLAAWLDSEKQNPQYQTILQEPSFRLSAYISIAQALDKHHYVTRARKAYESIAKIAPDSVEGRLAILAIARIDYQIREES